jgi:3-hydroxyacyl-CoA dehydrogenase
VLAPRAHSVGLVDRLIEGDIVKGAVAFAEELLAKNAPLRKVQDMEIDQEVHNDEYFNAFRQSIARKTRCMNAP